MVWLDNLDPKQRQTKVIKLDKLDFSEDNPEMNCLIKKAEQLGRTKLIQLDKIN